MAILRFMLLSLIFIFFCGSSLVEYGLFPGAINSFAPELLILALFFTSISKCKRAGLAFRFPGKYFVILLLAQTVASTVINEVNWLNSVLMLRVVLRFYVMFLALVNLRLSDKSVRRYIKYIAILFLIQIPVAAFKLTIFGQGESAIGTYATHGGVNSTTIPMIATGFLLTHYFTYRRSSWYITLILSFVAFGLIGGKKAIFIVVPLVCLFALWNARMYFSSKRIIPFVYFPLTVLLMIIVTYVGVRAHPRLNPDGKFWGRFDLNYTIKFSFEYSTVDKYASTGSRGGTMLRSLEHVNRDWTSRLFGLGPGRVMKSRFPELDKSDKSSFQSKLHHSVLYELEIYYGLSGVAWLFLQLGYPGAIIWIGFFVYMFAMVKRMAAREPDRFWRSYYLGHCCFTFTVLWITFTYGSVFISSDLMPFLYFMLLAFAYIHHYQTGRQTRPIDNSNSRNAVPRAAHRT